VRGDARSALAGSAARAGGTATCRDLGSQLLTIIDIACVWWYLWNSGAPAWHAS
jgi:hypothetical protein